MAYVHKSLFTCDLFISYARVDNTPTPAEKKGWVETFIEYLTINLEKRIGRSNVIKVWWDSPDLAGNRPIDQTIKDTLQKSALFLALTSEGYLHSECYCPKELA